jgi:hypothetical protein
VVEAGWVEAVVEAGWEEEEEEEEAVVVEEVEEANLASALGTAPEPVGKRGRRGEHMRARTGAAPVPGPMLAQSAGDLWGSRGDLGGVSAGDLWGSREELDGAHLGAPSCAVRLRLHSVAPPSLAPHTAPNMARPPHVAPHAAPNMAPPSLDSVSSLGSPTLDSPTTRSLIEQWMDSVGLAGVNATD